MGANFDNSPRGLKFQDWMRDNGKTKCVMADNKNDKNVTSLYQPGRTGIRVKGFMTQYYKKSSVDPCNLGWFCSTLLFSNPNQKCRVISMYNICRRVSEGLRTQYQQIMQYIQNNNITHQNPRQLFIQNFVKQCKAWKEAGDNPIMIGDINDDAISGKLTRCLKKRVDLEEFTSPFWYSKPPASHVNGNKFIILGMKSRNIEVT